MHSKEPNSSFHDFMYRERLKRNKPTSFWEKRVLLDLSYVWNLYINEFDKNNLQRKEIKQTFIQLLISPKSIFPESMRRFNGTRSLMKRPLNGTAISGSCGAWGTLPLSPA